MTGPYLHMTCGFPPEGVGGVEQHALEVCREFRRRGRDSHILTRGVRDDVAEYGVYRDLFDGIPVTRVVYRWSAARSLAYLYDDPGLTPVFAEEIEGIRPRLVHVHHLTGLGLGCLGELKRRRIPFVMTMHDYWMMCPRGQMYHAKGHPCDRVEPERCAPCIAATWPGLVPSGGGEPLTPGDDSATVAALHDRLREALSLPDRLIVASPEVRERYTAFGVPAERIEVAVYGQNHAIFAGLRRRPADRVRFGFVGTLIPSKGAHDLLQAFADLPPGTASLQIVGNAPSYHGDTTYMDRLRDLGARVPPENPVTVEGAYDHADLPSLLAGVDVLVVPPVWHEAYGLTLREGMLAGCAVITSAAGGLPAAVEEGVNGFTYPPGDWRALAERMRRFVDQPGLAARLGAHPTPIRNLEQMGDQLQGIYDALTR